MAEDDSEDEYIGSESDESPEVSEQNAREVGSRPAQESKSTKQPSRKGFLSNEYRDLLNLEIEGVNARGQTTQLGSSQIGASIWTSREKEAFFRRLATCGPDDLPALRRAVHSKGEQEVRAYLLLLQDRAATHEPPQTKNQKHIAFSHADIPAAAEISLECEHILDLTADALAAHVEKHTSQQEYDRFGDDWLIDEDRAERMDILQEQTQPEPDLNVNGPTEADEALDSPTLEFDGATLLCPSSFLQLSRNIFMNNCENDDLNWHHIESISAHSAEPALFFTALNDFRNMAINITRRLVQATLFQATSRLRAEDSSRKDWTPLGAIREVDVRAAIDILNLPNDSKTYWATVARRCRVGVYSDSRKFEDGRPSTRSGHRLTYDEVESELGSQRAEGKTRLWQPEADKVDEDHVDDIMDDSDLFTEDDNVGSSPGSSLEQDSQAASKASKKRKRALSVDSLLRADKTFLEALDKASSATEERRLWEMLRLEPPEHITMDQKNPADRHATMAFGDTPVHWRSDLHYEAEWEQPDGMPTTACFKNMDVEGKAGRKNREVAFEKVRRQLEVERGPDLGNDVANLRTFDDGNHANDDDGETAEKPATLTVDSMTNESES